MGEPERRLGHDGKFRSVPTRQPQPTPEGQAQDDADRSGDESEVEDGFNQVDGKGDTFEGDDNEPPDDSDPDREDPAPPQIAEPTAANIVVSRAGSSGPAEPQSPEPTEAELSDEAWLETLPARAGLNDRCREKFDKDAICYRHGKKFMDEYRRNMRPLLQKARVGGDYTADANQQIESLHNTKGIGANPMPAAV